MIEMMSTDEFFKSTFSDDFLKNAEAEYMKINTITVNGKLNFQRIIPPLWETQKPAECTAGSDELFNLCNGNPWRCWILQNKIEVVFEHGGVEYLVTLGPGFITDKVSNPFRNDAFAAMIPALVHDLFWVIHPVDFRTCNSIFRDMLRCNEYIWEGRRMRVPAFGRFRAGYYHAGVSLARRSFNNQPRARKEWCERTGYVCMFNDDDWRQK